MGAHQGVCTAWPVNAGMGRLGMTSEPINALLRFADHLLASGDDAGRTKAR